VLYANRAVVSGGWRRAQALRARTDRVMIVVWIIGMLGTRTVIRAVEQGGDDSV
jgi:hypothetical protein